MNRQTAIPQEQVMSTQHNNPHHTIRLYFVVLYIILVAGIAMFSSFITSEQSEVWLFMAAATLAYPALYLFLPLLLTTISVVTLAPGIKQGCWRKHCCNAVAWFTTSLVLVLLYADYNLFQLYEYHFNSFVWNLITTPGGIDSLGATVSTQLTYAGEVLAIVFINAALLTLIDRLPQNIRTLRISRRSFALCAIIPLLILCAEETVTAHSRYTSNGKYFEAISVIPLHLKSTASSLFDRLDVKKGQHRQINFSKGSMRYPLAPLETMQQKAPNIVWLTAESFRWDLLDPEITPNLWAFAKKSSTFKNHFSGGNRTRMGMMSMFYGLYPPYWYNLQKEKIRPVLMNQLIDKNYQLTLNTSQSFTYPELNDTVFAHIPADCKQELQTGPAWQRDHDNTSDIIKFIKDRDTTRPFFSFMFYESTHAPYTFPKQAAIKVPYMVDVNYARLSTKLGEIEPLRNRYINAAHHIDSEVGRLFNYLEKNSLLESTIVLFTGDHGEEFMEKGKWGHGHHQAFPSYQIRVPLVLWLPNEPARIITHPTSHLQIPATLLPRLGVTSPATTYSSATDLFGPQMPYLITGNHDHMAILQEKTNISFPFTTSKFFHYLVRDENDDLVSRKSKEEILFSSQQIIQDVLDESHRFIQ